MAKSPSSQLCIGAFSSIFPTSYASYIFFHSCLVQVYAMWKEVFWPFRCWQTWTCYPVVTPTYCTFCSPSWNEFISLIKYTFHKLSYTVWFYFHQVTTLMLLSWTWGIVYTVPSQIYSDWSFVSQQLLGDLKKSDSYLLQLNKSDPMFVGIQICEPWVEAFIRLALSNSSAGTQAVPVIQRRTSAMKTCSHCRLHCQLKVASNLELM